VISDFWFLVFGFWFGCWFSVLGFAICHLPFAIYFLPFAICYLPITFVVAAMVTSISAKSSAPKESPLVQAKWRESTISYSP
jgi:uncharacterized membrane protein YccF (DUF307 family)